MPTCAELAKKIEALESAFKEQLETAVKEFKAEARKTLDDKGLEEHAKLCESVKFLSAQYDNMCVKQNALIAENKALRAHNESLETRLAELEQYSRQNNIEIKGVPTTKGEDCTAILKRMGDAIGCTVTPADIDTVHRVPTKSAVNNIIARFCSRDKKNDFIRKARKARLRTGSIGFSESSDQAIYTNDHLTAENKKLFARALALKKEHQWKFLWTENCRILARKSEDTRVFRINTASDLSIFI